MNGLLTSSDERILKLISNELTKNATRAVEMRQGLVDENTGVSNSGRVLSSRTLSSDIMYFRKDMSSI